MNAQPQTALTPSNGASTDSERRLAFLLKLSDNLRHLRDPVEIQEATARLLVEELGVDRAAYGEVDASGELISVTRDWCRPGVPSAAGQYRINDFGEFSRELRHTGAVVVSDCLDDARVARETYAQTWGVTGTRAVVAHALVKEDQLVAALFVVQGEPRDWTDTEVAIVAEVGERTWEAVERARAEERFRAEEDKYRRLFESIDAGFCIIEVLFDSQHKPIDYLFLEANAAFERHTGIANPVGRRVLEMLPGHEQHWFDAYGHIVDTREPQRFEERADVLGRWYEVYAFPVGEAAEHRVAVLFSDISDRRRSEAALLESERRSRALAADRERLLEAERAARHDADHAMRVKDEFLATLSHELRTPLSSIVSWGRMLQIKFGKGEELLAKGLKVIADNAMTQAQLISDLLDTSRIVSGKFELEVEPVDLPDLIRSTYISQRFAAEGKGITLECQVDDGIGTIFADGTRLRQVVSNLLSNAIKFTPAGGRVTLSCRKRGDKYAVVVEDSGEGIDAEFLPLLFDRFRQADSSRSRRHGGLGLGLAIAKQIVDMHGGSIEADSPGAGQGSRFTVLLPEHPFSATLAPGRIELQPEAPRDSLKGLRILAVEDQPDMRDFLKRILEEQKAEVTAVETATGALNLLRARGDVGFDVLISDLGLPVMDGYEFIHTVRHELQLDAEKLPAVAVTAFARLEDADSALNAGYQAHLPKPYSASSLIALLKRLDMGSAHH